MNYLTTIKVHKYPFDEDNDQILPRVECAEVVYEGT